MGRPVTAPSPVGVEPPRQLDDDLVHWLCCLATPPSRALCGTDIDRFAGEDETINCAVCIDLGEGLDRSGRCPARHRCCPQYDDICEDM